MPPRRFVLMMTYVDLVVLFVCDGLEISFATYIFSFFTVDTLSIPTYVPT